MKNLLALLILALTAPLTTIAQPTTRVGNLVVTGDSADFGSSTVDLADAELVFADAQIPQAKVSGLVSDLAGKQPIDATLTALAGVTFAADQLIYSTGPDAFATTALTSFARTLLDDTNAAAMRTTLGLVVGTNVQAYDADLGQVAGLSGTGFAVRTASNTWAQRTITSSGLAVTSNGNGVSGNPSIAVPKATPAQVIAGEDDASAVTPAGNKAALDARVADTLSSAALVFDGGAGSKALIDVDALGQSDFWLFGWVRLASGAPDNARLIGGLGSTSDFFVNTQGDRRIGYFDGTDIYVPSPNQILPLGRWAFYECWRASGVLYAAINGGAPGSVPLTADISRLLTLGEAGVGVANIRGQVVRTSVLNFAPDSTDRAEVYARLGVIPPRMRAGGRTRLRDGDFELGTTSDWAIPPTATVTSIVAADESITTLSGTRILKVTTSDVQVPYLWNAPAPAGTVVRFRGRLYIKSGGPDLIIALNDGWAARIETKIDGVPTLHNSLFSPTPDTWHDFELRARINAGRNDCTFFVSCEVGGTYYLDDVALETEGAVYTQPDANQGAGPVLRASHGADTVLPGDGHLLGGVVRANPAASPYTLKFPLNKGGPGSKVLGDVDVARIPAGWVITDVQVYAGPDTVEDLVWFGTSAGTKEITAEVTVAAGELVRFPVKDSRPIFDEFARLWVTSNDELSADSYALITITPAQ